METNKEPLTAGAIFVVTRKSNEQSENENFTVHEIVFPDRNSLCRFGELLCALKEVDSFGIYDVTCDNEDEKPVFNIVTLEPIDGEHPFTQNIEEDLD